MKTQNEVCQADLPRGFQSRRGIQEQPLRYAPKYNRRSVLKKLAVQRGKTKESLISFRRIPSSIGQDCKMKKLSLTIPQGWQRLASLRLRWKLVIIAFAALLVFLLSKGPPPGQNHFVYLADAFLHGKLGVSGGGTDLAEIVPFNGSYYVVYQIGRAHV